MKRRAFFGLMGGAVAAGPGMVKQAAAETMDDLRVSGGGVAQSAGLLGNPGLPVGEEDWARGSLQKLLGRTAEQHIWHKSRYSVHALDPDIAALRSVSLGHKIRMQREVGYWRDLRDERGWLERKIAGFFDQ